MLWCYFVPKPRLPRGNIKKKAPDSATQFGLSPPPWHWQKGSARASWWPSDVLPHRCPVYMAGPRLPYLPEMKTGASISLNFLKQTTFCLLLMFSTWLLQQKFPGSETSIETNHHVPAAIYQSSKKPPEAVKMSLMCTCVAGLDTGGRSLALCWVGWHQALLSIGPSACPNVCWGLQENRAEGKKTFTLHPLGSNGNTGSFS